MTMLVKAPHLLTRYLFSSKRGLLISLVTRYAQTQNSNANNISEIVSNNALRTHYCGKLTAANVGTTVRIAGWLEHKHNNKFITLRDFTGKCQVLLSGDSHLLPRKESIVSVEGVVAHRPTADVNVDMQSGNIEIQCDKFKVINECLHLPFPTNRQSSTRESLRMKYRYIDLRSQTMQRNLRLRSSMLLKMRRFLCEQRGFVDVETPTLFRKTPGGAQEFLVPTQFAGKFYSLPQSPQQFKQLLMAGGIDKYMQVARCYRDEGARPDRQPEFTQLDLEMSFVTPDEVKLIVENMIEYCWPADIDKLTFPFPCMTFRETLSTYGTDKPDTRYGMMIQDVTSCLDNVSVFESIMSSAAGVVKAICVPKNLLTNSQVNKMLSEVKDMYSAQVAMATVQEAGVWKSALSKYLNIQTCQKVNNICGASPGDILFISAESDWTRACTVLGKIRTFVAHYAALNGKSLYNSSKFNFLWIDDFPLFETTEDGKLISAHHPFTAAHSDDLDLIYTKPDKVRGQHYDLVLNGFEVGGGSIRIHDESLQRYVLEKVLKENCSQLNHLLEALQSGCPPHGGIALGIDRLLAILCNASSIRDVIVFPKSSDGSDPMTGAPCHVSSEELKLYHIDAVE